ncbi:MAG: hypothetical protein ACM3QU_14795 [Verrucomicrobiota bacterium]
MVMLAQATMQSFYAGDTPAMVRTAERATELAVGLDGRAAILAGLARGMALVFQGEGQRRSLDPQRAPRAARPCRARDWATTDEWPAAHSAHSEGIALARETGQGVALAFGLAGLAWLEARQGREAECRAHAAEGREACIRAGVGVHEFWTLAALGDLEFGFGRPEAALAGPGGRRCCRRRASRAECPGEGPVLGAGARGARRSPPSSSRGPRSPSSSTTTAAADRGRAAVTGSAESGLAERPGRSETGFNWPCG